jgi:RNA polymerase sigma-70 factor (ECF subfamily)
MIERHVQAPPRTQRNQRNWGAAALEKPVMTERPPNQNNRPAEPALKGAANVEITPLSVLKRARSKDPQAWRRLIDLYQPLVRFWCSQAGLRGPDAEDTTQEVFAAAALNLDGFHRDRPGDTFRGWLRTITRNQVLLHFRRSQGKAQAEGGSDALHKLQQTPDPLAGREEEEGTEMAQVYRRALEQVRAAFEEPTWQAFWRTAIEGQSPTALTAELSMTPAAIRQAKSRVLRRLRDELGEVLE